MNSRRIDKDKSLAALYPEIAVQWHPAMNGDLTPYDVGSGSNVKVWWMCDKGHKWQAMPCHRTKHRSGCPYCSGNIVIPGKTDLQTLFPEIACEFDADKNKETTPSQVCAKSGKKIWWLCTKGTAGRRLLSAGQT